MMRLSRLVIVGLCILLGVPSLASANHIQATVGAVGAGSNPISNNDATDCTSDGQTCSLILSNPDGSAKMYGLIKIEAYYASSGPARIEVGPDGQGDRIILKNAKITVVTGSSVPIDYQITFWSTFTDPPTKMGGSEVISYELLGASMGTLKRGSFGATGDIVKARGFLGYPVQGDGTVLAGDWKQLTNTTGLSELSQNIAVASYSFFPSSSGTISENFPRAGGAALTGLRLLKAEFQFKFTQTSDVLLIPHTSGLLLRNQGATETW